MMLSRLRRVIIFALLISSTQTFADAAAVGCGERALSPALGFASYNHDLSEFLRLGRDQNPTDEELEVFWRLGWPSLFRWSSIVGVRPDELLLTAAEVVTIIADKDRSTLGNDVPLIDWGQWARLALSTLASLPNAKTFAELDVQERVNLGVAMSLFRSLSHGILGIQVYWRTSPSFDPLTPMDQEWMFNFVQAARAADLDVAIQISEQIDALASSERYWRLRSELSAPPPLTHSVKQSLATILKTNPATIDNDHPYDFELYDADGSTTKPVTVTFADTLVSELRGSHATQGERLLKALLLPANGKSGLKKLTSIHPELIEIKAVMRGHWRILGCLDGNRLRLLQLRDMPETVAGYARVITPNFCD